MGLLALLDTKEVEAFAVHLAEDLGRRFPPASEQRTDQGADTGLLVGRHRRLARRYRVRSWIVRVRFRFGERVDRAVGIGGARGLKRFEGPHGPQRFDRPHRPE